MLENAGLIDAKSAVHPKYIEVIIKIWRLEMYEKYVEALNSGCQVRIKYNIQHRDYCENDGWWSEELWCYDKEIDLYKCYYPISSYEKDFFTTHSQSDVEYFIKDAIRDYNGGYDEITVKNIIVENNAQDDSKSVKEVLLNKIKDMNEEDLKNLLLLI